MIAGNAPPIIAKLRRCVDGKDGKALKAELDHARSRVVASRAQTASITDRTDAAVAHARQHRLTPSNSDTAASTGRRRHPRAHEGMDVVNEDQRFRIASPFPTPPGAVLRALDLLQILRRGNPDEIAAAGDLSDLPRPWDPATCPGELREAVWEWCDLVAAWLNHEYAWRPTQMIPPCWPQHAHIARELAVLAILRWNAEESTTPEPVEEWHRYTFPMFCDRMTTRLGESGCRAAKHIDWPAEAR